MPNMNWSKLTTLQIGRYAEYYAQMEFASYGFDIYVSEVDDHGVDFVMSRKLLNYPHRFPEFYEVQVKCLRFDINDPNKRPYLYFKKSLMPCLTNQRILALLLFSEGRLPEFFVIPADQWSDEVIKSKETKLLVSHDYDHINAKSKPEYGVNFSNKNLKLLEEYRIEKWIETLNN